jgi:hypothetical protein
MRKLIYVRWRNKEIYFLGLTGLFTVPMAPRCLLPFFIQENIKTLLVAVLDLLPELEKRKVTIFNYFIVTVTKLTQFAEEEDQLVAHSDFYGNVWPNRYISQIPPFLFSQDFVKQELNSYAPSLQLDPL